MSEPNIPHQDPSAQPVDSPTIPLNTNYQQPVSPQPQTPAANYGSYDNTTATVIPQKTEQAPFIVGLVAQWTVLLETIKGNTINAFRIAQTVPMFWVAHLTAFAVIVGLFVSTSLARLAGAATGFTDNLVSELTMGYSRSYGYSTADYFGITFGTWVGFFFMAALLYLVVFFARALTVWWVFPIRGQKVSFKEAANIVAASFTAQLIWIAIVFILVFFPSASFVSIVVGFTLFFLGLLGFISELMLYTGINRTAPFVKSPLVIHGLMTGVFGVITVIAWFVVTSMFM